MAKSRKKNRKGGDHRMALPDEVVAARLGFAHLVLSGCTPTRRLVVGLAADAPTGSTPDPGPSCCDPS